VKVRIAGLAVIAALVPITATEAAAKGKPNLKVTDVGALPAAATEGTTLKLKVETTANKGAKRAGASTTRFYLTRDAKASIAERRASRTNPRSALTDVLLTGAREVPALDPGKASKTKKKKPTKLTVPIGTPAGEWELLACSDDRGVVKEKKEADNCLAAARLKVAALPGTLRTDSFTDFLVEDEEEVKQELSLMKPYLCPPVEGGGKVPKLDKALATVDAFLTKTAGADAMKAFEKSADAKSAAKLEGAAAAALLQQTPGAALAALVRAHELEPKEASHLIGAASVATAVGLPREALAMLDAAERLDDRTPSSWGLNRDALALANRGHALTALGKYADAEKALIAARALEPALKEASQTASMAALCQDKLQPAILFRKAGKDRTWPPPRPEEDDSLGKSSGLRELFLPATPKQGPALHPFYVQQQGPDHFADITARQQKEQQLRTKWENKDLNPLTRRQGNRLLVASYRASQSPKIKAMQKAYFDQVNVVHKIHEDFWCGDQGCTEATTEVTKYRNQATAICEASNEDWDSCFDREFGDRCRPATKLRHQEWLDEIQEAYDLADAHQRALSKRISAIASHAKDPDLHQLILIGIQDHEDGTFFLVQQPAMFWTNNLRIDEEHCVETPDPPAPGTPDSPAPGSSGPCPDALKSTNAVLDLEIVQLKFNCEQVQLTANGEGWIRGFAEVSYDYRAGKISVFAGSQAEIGAGPLKADFKSGLYMTVSNQGLEDAGWRVGPGYTVGAGPVEYNPSDMVDISFVGIFSGPSAG